MSLIYVFNLLIFQSPMLPVKILVVLFSFVNLGQMFMMSSGNIEKTRLTRLLKFFHIDFNIYPGFTLSIIIFFILIFAVFAFLKHFTNYKEHYSSFFSFLICINFLASFLAVIFNFFLYFMKG